MNEKQENYLKNMKNIFEKIMKTFFEVVFFAVGGFILFFRKRISCGKYRSF